MNCKPIAPMLRAAFAGLALLAFAASAAAQAPSQGARREAVITAANPHAAEAAAEILRKGGSAVDAAIAAELVLGLVEPQSSGLGGGGFLMHFNAATRSIDAYDGREIAPQGAAPNMFLDADGRPLAFRDAVMSGRSIGAPSLIPMLHLAHEEHGRLDWEELFEPAIRLADEGFQISPRMARMIALAAGNNGLTQAAARAYLLDASGAPLPAGTLLKNPAYAETLRALARNPNAMKNGPIAREIVAAARAEPLPGTLEMSDLRRVRPRKLSPVCGPFRRYLVCSMPPPSSGGVAVIELLGLYARAEPVPEDKDDPEDWAAFLWASRLAYADRDFYVADDRFVPVPTQGLIAKAYLDQRFREVELARAPRGIVDPGDPARYVGGPSLFNNWGRETTNEVPGTTHMSIMDHDGNVVALTATVESVFGSQRMAAGFFLNNQMTDFSFRPTLNGKPVANAVAPGKAPRSSMAPTIMLTPNGNFYAAIGSPGGGAIIAYVARTIIGFVDWRLSMQASIDLGHIVASGPIARRENRRVPASTARSLSSRGWVFRESDVEDSGLHGLRVTETGVEGGADPRREGVVLRVPANAPVAEQTAATAAPTR